MQTRQIGHMCASIAALCLTGCGAAAAQPVTGSWKSMAAFVGLDRPAFVWTGCEMLVWGRQWDCSSEPCGIGGRYDPASDTWSVMSSPTWIISRAGAESVWTGREMIVWGGRCSGNASRCDGGIAYNPNQDTWRALSDSAAPHGRENEAMVWTGKRVIAWGGAMNDPAHPDSPGDPPVDAGDGYSYDPDADKWSPISSAGAPSARDSPAALWTGNRLLVWSGWHLDDPDIDPVGAPLADGARYDPETDAWEPMSSIGAPRAGIGWHSAFWTGLEMLVWGRGDHPDGAAYNPSTDAWRKISTGGAPSISGEMVWTGRQLLVSRTRPEDAGGVYDLASNSWAAMSTIGAVVPRGNECAVWTGGEMIVWGGYLPTRNYPRDGARFTP